MDYKDLIKLFRHTVEHGDEEPREYCTNRCGGCELCDQAADAIEALLAERDAAVVAHGRWKRNHQCQLYCSRCLEYQDPAIEKPYCSNCGAKMDKEVRNV